MDFGVTRNEYILHSADSEHNRKLIENMNITDTNNNKNVESCKGSTNGVKTLSKDSDNNVLTEQLDSSSEEHQDAHTDDAAIDRERKLSNTLQQNIPNVFEDGIFDFLDSMKNSGNESEKLNKFPKAKALETGAIPKYSWRSSSNGNTQTAQVEQWRQNTNTDKSNHNSTPKSTLQAQAPVIQSIIQNGAIFTGVGIRPCPTYELNNMYLKFPHLNSAKVPNPLKPLQNSTNNARNKSAEFDKMSAERATSSRELKAKKSHSVHGSREMHELSSQSVSNKNSLAHRGRSSSSIDLTVVSKANHLTKQKDDHKLLTQKKTQSKNDKSSGAIPKQLNRNSAQMNVNGSPNSLDEVLDCPVDAQKLKSKRF